MRIVVVERNAGSRYFETIVTLRKPIPGPDQATLEKTVKISASCDHFSEAKARQAFKDTVAEYERKGYAVGS